MGNLTFLSSLFPREGFTFCLYILPNQEIIDKLPEALQKGMNKNLCVCNEVPKYKIINTIIEGATSVDEIKRKTYASMGAGCCKQQIERLLECLCDDPTDEKD